MTFMRAAISRTTAASTSVSTSGDSLHASYGSSGSSEAAAAPVGVHDGAGGRIGS